MTEARIEDLFDLHRYENAQLTLPMLVYFPFGLILFVIRFFIGVHAFLIACLIPKVYVVRGYILRVMCAVLGIIVLQQDVEHRNKNIRVITTNHLSSLDHLAVDLVCPCVMPGVWDLPKTLNWILGFQDLGITQGRDVLIQNVKELINSSSFPVLSHPEGATTNGKIGILKFSTWSFSLDHPVQPILITVTRPPLTNVSTSVLGGRWWSDIFWFLFVPFTMFTLKYLPVMYRREGETVDEFTKRVQNAMAHALKLAATPYTCADKVEYAKRILSSKNLYNETQQSQQPKTEINIMTQQVKEVLPDVPVEVIASDLAVTKCVDTTIARLLEGTVVYVPVSQAHSDQGSSQGAFHNHHSESSSSSKSVQNDKDSPSKPQPVIHVPSKNFGKTAEERMQSYQERKALLIENARRWYMNKHGIKEC